MALKFALERIGKFSCLAFQSSRTDIFALSPVMLSDNLAVFFHFFKQIKEKYIKLFLHLYLHSSKCIIQNHPIIQRHNTV